MVIFEEFIISLEENREEFNPGEFVNGFVVLRLSESLNIKRIFIKMRGQAKVCWSENQSRSNSCHFTNKCDYASFEKTFVEAAPGDQTHLLLQGNHLLPFTFQVPMSAVSSFEGTHGRIYYWLKAGVVRPSQLDITTKLAFSVTQRTDLSQNPKLKEAVVSQEEMQFGCCTCLLSKTLIVKAKVDRPWFNRGSDVPVSLTVQNGLNRNVKNISIRLVQELLYVAKTGKVKPERTVLETVTTDGVGSRETKHFEQILLPIPRNIPPTTRHCPCINIDYSIQIDVQYSKAYLKMGTLPFLLATSPLPSHGRIHNTKSWPVVVHAPSPYDPSPRGSPWGTPRPSPRISPRNSPRPSPRTSPSATPKSSPYLSRRSRWPTPHGSPVLNSRASLLKSEVLPAVDRRHATIGSHLELLPRKSI